MSKKPSSRKKYEWLTKYQTQQIQQTRKVIDKADKKNKESMFCKKCGQTGHSNAISITCPFNKNHLTTTSSSSSVQNPGQVISNQSVFVAYRNSINRVSASRTPSAQPSEGNFGAFFFNGREDPICTKCLRPGHTDNSDYRCRFFTVTSSTFSRYKTDK